MADNINQKPAMNSKQPGADKESPLPHPVKVITNADMAAYMKEMRPNTPTRPSVHVSPLGDKSVQGYATEQQPLQEGWKDILKVVKMLEGAGIPCGMVAEPALIYYGTGRVKTAWHLPCEPENFEYGHTGLPYPKLDIFAQSLLDTWNLIDLDDLVECMNLSLEWGEANLNLDGAIDTEWGRWKANALHGGKASVGDTPIWCSNPMKRRDIWEEVVSAKAKEKRQRHKLLLTNETRFRKRGGKDPRLFKREYC